MVKKGFAIVKYKNGKLIKNLNNLKINNDINIRFFKGVIDANIKKLKKTNCFFCFLLFVLFFLFNRYCTCSKS